MSEERLCNCGGLEFLSRLNVNTQAGTDAVKNLIGNCPEHGDEVDAWLRWMRNLTALESWRQVLETGGIG
jgi:hypothetical protein